MGKLMYPVTPSRRAIVLVETIVAMVLFLVLFFVLSSLAAQYTRASHHVLDKEQAICAAESILTEMRAGTRPAVSASGTMDSGATFEVDCRPGASPWNHMQQVSVTVTLPSRHGKTPEASISSYLPMSTEEVQP